MKSEQKKNLEDKQQENFQNEVKLLYLLGDAVSTARKRRRRETSLESLQITPLMIEEYLAVLSREGKTKDTMRIYRNILRYWYDFLPEEKRLTATTMEAFERHGREQSLSQKTIKNRKLVVSGFLKYLEYADDFRSKKKENSTPERAPRREEYYLILQAAKELGYRRAYLIIKTIVCLGIKALELDHLCVDGLSKEIILIPSRSRNRRIRVFEPLRTELLEYAAEHGVTDGPVFVTKEGHPMPQQLIAKEIKRVHLRTGLPEYKGLPKNLYLLYTNTRKEVAKGSVRDADINYLALLQQEEITIGWNSDGNILTIDSGILTKQCEKLFDNLSREEEDRVIKRLGNSLSEILSKKHKRKVTISYKREEKV